MTRKQFIRNRWFEDIPIGEFHVLGTHVFEKQAIIDFSTKYAPALYRTSLDASSKPLVDNKLIVAEWHIACIWMKLLVDYMERFALGVRDGRRNGAGVGLKEMLWLQPVRSGDKLAYTYEIIDKSERIVKDKWGIICSRNEAFNLDNECVFSFTADILAERDPTKLRSPFT